MSFDLSFGPEFFLAEGEPYDRGDDATDEQGRPVSVWTALSLKRSTDPEWWANLALEVFAIPAGRSEWLSEETVLRKIEETNTCSNLSTPVEVWVDSEGYYRLLVW